MSRAEPVEAQGRICARCGAALRHYALGRLCPSCMLQGGLGEPGPDASSGAAPVASLPQAFGDYELLEIIARGGMGVVYKARQKSLNRIVAVKMLLSGQFAEPKFVQRFRAEAEAVAQLQHPNIVAIHEIGECDGQPFFSMDYVEGKSLAQMNAEFGSRGLEFHRCANWVKTIAEAVQYAHERGIIHRDLKPSNVLIDSFDRPRITDFGLAKRLTGDSDLTLTGQVLGSPNYLPPEQADPKRGKVGPASDVYALGAILYHLVTGRPPFQAEALTTLLRQVIEAEPVAPRSLNASIPRDLETISLTCLEKDASRRYTAAQKVADELGRYLEGRPILARPVGPAARMWRWCGRNPRFGTAVGLAVLSLFVGLAGVSWQWRQAEAARVRAESNEKKAKTEAARSAQVAQFMKEMVAGVGPYVAQGRDTTVLQEIMNQTIERLAKDLPNQPEVRTELLLTIGNTFMELGEHTRAETLTREAVRLRRTVFAETNVLVADSLWTLAAVLARGGTTPGKTEAKRLLRQALAIQRTLLGDESADVARTLGLLAGVLNLEGKWDEAEALSREALRVHRKLFGNDHPDVAQSLVNLAAVLRDQGKLEEADGAARQALAWVDKSAGPLRPDRGYVLRILGSILRRQGKHAEAESALRQSLDIARKVYGETNDYAGVIATELAACLSQSNLVEAEALYREFLSISESNNPAHFTGSANRARLGANLLAQKKFYEAELLLLSGYEGMTQRKGKRAAASVAFIRQTLQNLVRLYEETNRPEEANRWKQKLADFNKAGSTKKPEAARPAVQ